MKISRRERILVAVCVVAVAVIGVPSLKQIRLLGGGGGGGTAQLSSATSRSRRDAERLRAEIAGLEKAVRSHTWAEDAERLPPLLLKELHATAAGAGVTLAGFRPGRVQAVPAGAKLPITVQIRAPFPKAAAFLQRLQETQQRVAVERVQVAATDAATDAVAMELRLAVYSTARAQTAKPQAK